MADFHRMSEWLCCAASFALAVAVTGCSSIGPSTLPRDRTDYLSSLANSWKEQTLSNVVHIRYGDTPAFIDVSSIVSSYVLSGDVSAGLTVNSNTTSPANAVPWNTSVFGIGGSYQDRPTISYQPLVGDKFTKRLIRPIPPLGIFELIQAGNAADVVLQFTVRSLNGIRNQGTSGGVSVPADPLFYPMLDAFRRLQVAGRLSVRSEKRGGEEVGIFVISEGLTPQEQQDIKFLRDTLRVRTGKDGELVIVFGAHRARQHGKLVAGALMGDILIDLAMDVEVPPEHVAEGRTVATVRTMSAPNPRDRPMVRIRSGSMAPAGAFAAVRYGNTSFWIDSNDYASKRTFTLLMIFTSLAETGVTPQTPQLTLPVR